MSHSATIAGTVHTSRAMLADFLATTIGRTLARLVLALLILGAWQFQPDQNLRFWMSGPLEIVTRLLSWIADGSLWENVGATLLAMALGYAIGTGAGITLGLLFGLMPRLYRVLSPYITALYAMPKIALAPLFIIVLGIGIGIAVGSAVGGPTTGAVNGFFFALLALSAWPWIMPESIENWMNDYYA